MSSLPPFGSGFGSALLLLGVLLALVTALGWVGALFGYPKAFTSLVVSVVFVACVDLGGGLIWFVLGVALVHFVVAFRADRSARRTSVSEDAA